MLYNGFMSIQDKAIIVTGAGSGIGRATALRFTRGGAHVVLFGRTREKLDAVTAQIRGEGNDALAVVGDVAREEDVQALFARTVEVYGRVDILINCAGVVAVQPFAEMSIETWDHVLAINLRGTFLCCQRAFRLMSQQGGGVILNISSLSGIKGVEKFPGLSAYNVSKAGIASLTEILAVEGKPYKIRVAAVSPGAVDTEMLRQAAPHLKADMTPDELAEILCFMADDSGRVLSGTNLEIFSNA
jgi:NAD(P)-dependent dehydrogenase (short-subunit alcohol dehydrogenase family)